MSKGSSQKQAAPPTAPAPESTPEYTYLNGQLVSSRTKSTKAGGGWEDNMYMNPNEQRAYDSGQQQFADLLGQVQPAIAVNDQQRQAFADKLYQPQAQQLTKEYNNMLGETMGAANASGVLGSVGQQDYISRKLADTYMQNMSNLRNQAELQSYDLGNLQLAPIQNALSIFDTSINSPTSRAMSMMDPSFQGSQAAYNASMQKYNADLNRWAAMNQQQQSRGFKLF